jgi:hypothetical protein
MKHQTKPNKWSPSHTVGLELKNFRRVNSLHPTAIKPKDYSLKVSIPHGGLRTPNDHIN